MYKPYEELWLGTLDITI